ncbi:uncharacterized protein LOC131651137 [Vicia villosa]|uniref:uncharacterized protein LOC131651137 n=1 Tax=Vicia villosa TaxID=3911 RepID=UPI00273BF99D|nr:uncharacterized protein LOC131651137 [Vicia villosa]
MSGVVHPDNIVRDELEVPKEVNVDAKSKEPINDVKKIVVSVDVRPQFTNEMTFTCRGHLLEWVQNEASKLGFGVVIARSDDGTSRRKAFVMMRCERGGKYVPTNRKLKHDDTGSRMCACPFKLCVSCRVDGLWPFRVICRIHNHALETKLHGHRIMCQLNREEKDFISKLSIIKVVPRNILVDLKRKRLDSALVPFTFTRRKIKRQVHPI